MLRSPLLLTLDLTRARQAEDPYAFRFEPQDYLARTEGGAVARLALEWDQTWLDDLAEIRLGDPSASTQKRVGERLAHFLAGAGWAAQAAAIEGVVRAGRAVILTVRSTAAELYTLPWELISLGPTGQHLGELDGVVLRYEWPETTTVPELRAPRSEHGHVLLAWSSAGGPVPAAEHVEVISSAWEAGGRAFDREQDVLGHASLESLEERLDRALHDGPPVDVLHLLGHGSGGLDGGLLLDGEGENSARVGPERLRQLLRRYAGMIRLVVFSACESADPGDVARALGGLSQVLHRTGIAAVIGSRFPLSVDASLRFSRTLYEGLVLSLLSLEESVARARTELRQLDSRVSWATLQLYSRRSDGDDSRPIVVRPYRGLLSFGPEDERLFYGRAREVEELRQDLAALAKSGRPRLMIVAGASGSGKSSVILAGLVPSLLGDPEEAWGWFHMRPGASPMSALASAAKRLLGRSVEAEPAAISGALTGWRKEHSDRPLLLVVDQLEELFTQGADRDERELFARLLWSLAGDEGSPLTIVTTLRVDFIGACGELILDDRGLRLDRIAYDERHRTFVARADRRLLRTVIESPARSVGLSFDPGLVERLVDEIDGDSGALPAISHALDLLWHRRRGRTLTQEGYGEIGGVRGALALHAERIIDALDEDELSQARRLLIRLVSDADKERSPNTRTRLPVDRLRPVGPEADAFERVVQRLTERRLLVLCQGDGKREQAQGRTNASELFIEVAHERLLHAWPRLERWVSEDRERISELRRLGGWVVDHDERGTVLDGPRLAAAQEFASRHPEDVEPRALALIDASLRAHGEAARIEADRRAELERSLSRTRRAALLTSLVALLALVLAFLSERTYSAFQRESQLRLDAPLYDLLERMPAEDPRQVLDVLAEIEITDEAAWMSTADTALRQLPEQRLLSQEPTIEGISVSAAGLVAVRSSRSDELQVIAIDNPRRSVQDLELGAVEDAAWDPEGRLLVLQSDGHLLELSPDDEGWLDETRPLRTIALGGPASLVLSQERGRHEVALSEPEDHRARIIDLDSDEVIVIDGGDAPFSTIALIDRGRSLLTASGDLSVSEIGDRNLRIWDTRTGALRSTFALEGDLAIAVAATSERDEILAITRSGELLTWLRSAPESPPRRSPVGHGELVAAAFGPASAEVALLSNSAGELVLQPLPEGPPIPLRSSAGEHRPILTWWGQEQALATGRGGLYSYRADGRRHNPRQMSEAMLRARVYEVATCMPFADLQRLASRYEIDEITQRNLCVDGRTSRISELLREGEVLVVLLLPLLFFLELLLVGAVLLRRRRSSAEPAPAASSEENGPALGLAITAIILGLAAGLAFSAINVLKGDDGSSVIAFGFAALWLFSAGLRLSPLRLGDMSPIVHRALRLAQALTLASALLLGAVLIGAYGLSWLVNGDETGALPTALYTFSLLLLTLLAVFAVGLHQTSRWLSPPAQRRPRPRPRPGEDTQEGPEAATPSAAHTSSRPPLDRS